MDNPLLARRRPHRRRLGHCVFQSSSPTWRVCRIWMTTKAITLPRILLHRSHLHLRRHLKYPTSNCHHHVHLAVISCSKDGLSFTPACSPLPTTFFAPRTLSLPLPLAPSSPATAAAPPILLRNYSRPNGSCYVESLTTPLRDEEDNNKTICSMHDVSQNTALFELMDFELDLSCLSTLPSPAASISDILPDTPSPPSPEPQLSRAPAIDPANCGT